MGPMRPCLHSHQGTAASHSLTLAYGACLSWNGNRKTGHGYLRLLSLCHLLKLDLVRYQVFWLRGARLVGLPPCSAVLAHAGIPSRARSRTSSH